MDAIAILKSITYLQPITNIEKIQSGLSHHCFKVTANTKTFFVKIYRSAPTLLFTEQIKIEQLAGEQGLSPRVIEYCSLGTYCIYQYIAGETLLAANITDDIKNSSVVELLRTCHALEYKAPPLDIAKSIKSLLQMARLSQVTKSNILDGVHTSLEKLALNLGTLVLCHGDLNFSNVLLADNNLVLVDWEYCCLAEREYDIAMALAINNIATDQYAAIVAEYNLKTKTTPADLNKVMQYITLCELLNTLWFIQNTDLHTTCNDPLSTKAGQVLKPYIGC